MKEGQPMTTANPNQLFVFTGPRGSGKTTLALTYLPPSQLDKVVVIDSENSANSFRQAINKQNKDFGLYINLLERFKDKLPTDDDLLKRISNGNIPWSDGKEQGMFIDLYQHILERVNQIPHGKYKYLVIDTGEKLEAGIAAYAELNKKKLGITDTAYGKLWVNGVFPLYQYLLQGIWDRGIETISINFHLKNVWEGKRPVPGKTTHGGKKILYYLSSLMVWLVNDSRNPSGAPAGLVLKERMGKVGIANDEWDIKTMIPPRIPNCTWKDINRYLKDGFNNASPNEREIMSASEREMISELLTDAQVRLMLADIETEREQNAIAMAEAGILPTTEVSTMTTEEVSDLPTTRSEAIVRWKSMGKPVGTLLKKLNERGIADDQIAGNWEQLIRDGG